MPSLFQSLASLLPYHVFSYGALFGFQTYQSFINTRMSYVHLPAPQFRHLSKHIFPVYFASTSILTLFAALTHPPHSVFSLVSSPSSYIPLCIAFAASSLNYGVFGPQTSQAMKQRSHQEYLVQGTKEAKDGPSEDTIRVNRRFKIAHVKVVHVNVIGLVAVVAYGIVLVSRLKIEEK